MTKNALESREQSRGQESPQTSSGDGISPTKSLRWAELAWHSPLSAILKANEYIAFVLITSSSGTCDGNLVLFVQNEVNVLNFNSFRESSHQNFYRTQVRSLPCLVCQPVTLSLSLLLLNFAKIVEFLKLLKETRKSKLCGFWKGR